MQKISLRAARVNARLTQKEVADRIKVSNSTLCSWENGKTFPDQPNIDKLCSLYGVTYDAIDFAAKQ